MIAKHIKFADKYFETDNALESAIYAGYSPKTAKEQGYKIKERDDVKQYLAEQRKKYAKKHDVTKDRLIEEYAKIAFFDIRDIYSEDGNLVNIKDLDSKSAGAISSIKSFEEYETDKAGNKNLIGTNKEIRVFDKIRALQDLGKHLGLFEKDNEQKKSEVNINLSKEKIKQISDTLENDL